MGSTLCVIKKCWAVIREDFMQMLDEFHTNGKLVRGLNPSFVALIPKKEGCNELVGL